MQCSHNAVKSVSFWQLPSLLRNQIKGRKKLDTNIKKLYDLLHYEYPIELKSSKEMGFKSNIDFPVLCETSALGKFELFQGDLDFEFCSIKEDGEFLAHLHLRSITEAEQTVIDFMNNKITIIQFGQSNNI